MVAKKRICPQNEAFSTCLKREMLNNVTANSWVCGWRFDRTVRAGVGLVQYYYYTSSFHSYPLIKTTQAIVCLNTFERLVCRDLKGIE